MTGFFSYKQILGMKLLTNRLGFLIIQTLGNA